MSAGGSIDPSCRSIRRSRGRSIQKASRRRASSIDRSIATCQGASETPCPASNRSIDQQTECWVDARVSKACTLGRIDLPRRATTCVYLARLGYFLDRRGRATGGWDGPCVFFRDVCCQYPVTPPDLSPTDSIDRSTHCTKGPPHTSKQGKGRKAKA